MKMISVRAWRITRAKDGLNLWFDPLTEFPQLHTLDSVEQSAVANGEVPLPWDLSHGQQLEMALADERAPDYAW